MCYAVVKGIAAKQSIIKINKNITGNNELNLNIDVMKLDLSSIASIDSFVAEFKSKYSSLDVLIANAAILQ